MKKEEKRERRGVGRFVYWTPRILSILFILFLAIFSLDVFDSCNSFLTCLGGLFMHNIPVFILAILLFISWKREIIGAWTFFIGGLLYAGLTLSTVIRNGFEWYYLAWIAQISGVAFFIGVLFYLNWRRKK